jgi:acetyltransferase-like isoleucine patch superfamily enzyme
MNDKISIRGAAYFRKALGRGRIWKYRALSTCPNVSGSPILRQPVLFVGDGSIVLGREVEFGWPTSALFYTGYCHIEASKPGSVVEFGHGVEVNNNAFIKSEGPGIRIGARALLGSGVTIYDSDFHDLRPNRRREGRPRMAPVELGEDVFVGDGVKILKGVSIGAHSVIGAGSVVTSSIPAGVIVAGNPARVIRALDEVSAEDLLAVGR